MGSGFGFVFAVTILPKFNHGQPVWKINYSILGRQKRKFFKRDPANGKQCPGLAEAQKFVKDLTRQTFNEGPTMASLTASERIEMLTLYAKIRERKLTTQQVLEILDRSHTQSPSVAQVVEECLTAKKAVGKRPRYIKQLKSTLQKFAASSAHMNMSEVTPSHIEQWLGMGDYSLASRKTRLTDVQTLCSLDRKSVV